MARRARTTLALLVALACTIPIAQGAAQVPSTRLALAGTWTLDQYVSDHPEEVARKLRLAAMATERPVRDVPFDPSGRGGGRPGGAIVEPKPSLSADDQQLLWELAEAVRFPATTLTLAVSETTVSIASSDNTVGEVLRTNGKPEKQQFSSGVVKRIAQWDGPRQLVIAYDAGAIGILRYNYEVAPTSGQLVIRVNFERRPGEPGPIDIRLVYNRAVSSTP